MPGVHTIKISSIASYLLTAIFTVVESTSETKMYHDDFAKYGQVSKEPKDMNVQRRTTSFVELVIMTMKWWGTSASSYRSKIANSSGGLYTTSFDSLQVIRTDTKKWKLANNFQHAHSRRPFANCSHVSKETGQKLCRISWHRVDIPRTYAIDSRSFDETCKMMYRWHPFVLYAYQSCRSFDKL